MFSAPAAVTALPLACIQLEKMPASHPFLLLALAAAFSTAAGQPATAPGVRCFSYSSKYNYCFAVMEKDPDSAARCAAKNRTFYFSLNATRLICYRSDVAPCVVLL
jgi:hypothetical protein